MGIAESSKLKPLPSSDDEFKAEYDSFKNFDETSEPIPRAILYHFLLSSTKIQRHFKSAMIMLLGSSGSGKSSTINHLLDTGDRILAAETSNYDSATKKTSEYIITFDEPKYEVSDLTLRIIDTSGFNNGDSVEQDAWNFLSIKKYLETHPEFSSKTKIYPNLVFIVDKANNNRIKGINSSLSKSLRCIKMLNIVDISHPNLVVILTHACSVGHANPKKWQETMQEKKELVSDIVFETLGVMAPVVLIENDPNNEHELERDGDFTILPNGERQPLNLYNSCISLLEKAEMARKRDKFGHMLLNAAFHQKKKALRNGHEFKRKQSLEAETKLFNEFIQATNKGITNLLAKRAKEYVSENNIQDESVKKNFFGLVETMNAMGLSDDSRFKHTTISEIDYQYDGIITENGLQMLETKFGVKCAESFQEAELIGQGYNLVTDDFVSAQVLKLSLVDIKEYGIRIPEFAQVLKSNETVVSEIHLQRKNSNESLLSALGLNVNKAPEFDANHSMGRQKNDSGSSTQKMLKEVRMAKISVDYVKITFTDEFLSAVENLPSENIEDENVMKEFKDFFNRFGQFLVTSVYVGGSVDYDTHDEESVDGGICASLLCRSILSYKRKATQWKGGRSDLHVDGTLHSNERFRERKMSIPRYPAFLANKLTMEPISTLIGMIDTKRGNLSHGALQEYFQNQDLNLARDDESKTKLQVEIKQLKQKEKPNSRGGSIKQPDTTDWWKMFDGCVAKKN